MTTLAVTNLITGIAYMLLLGGLGNSYERTHSKAWAAVAIGIWTCIAPWVVADGIAHTRSITSNLLASAIATLLALPPPPPPAPATSTSVVVTSARSRTTPCPESTDPPGGARCPGRTEQQARGSTTQAAGNGIQ
ncbi:SPW repeat protein [Streptomyces sp. NPDC059957]|uniref:SPW repeat domain-containing protein n=1 Tax=Streptomyces sp. NPDC059957 TaxID=3347016 RepID=UPI00364C0425